MHSNQSRVSLNPFRVHPNMAGVHFILVRVHSDKDGVHFNKVRVHPNSIRDPLEQGLSPLEQGPSALEQGLSALELEWSSLHQGQNALGPNPRFTRTRTGCTRTRLKCTPWRFECTGTVPESTRARPESICAGFTIQWNRLRVTPGFQRRPGPALLSETNASNIPSRTSRHGVFVIPKFGRFPCRRLRPLCRARNPRSTAVCRTRWSDALKVRLPRSPRFS